MKISHLKPATSNIDFCVLMAVHANNEVDDYGIKDHEISGSTVNLARRAMARLEASTAAAKRMGYIGVGVISFNQMQHEKWLRRVIKVLQRRAENQRVSYSIAREEELRGF